MRILRRAFRIVVFLVLVALAFLAGMVGVLTLTERGRDNLAGIISDLASSPGQIVTISGLGGIWSGELTVDNLVVEDATGPWLVARGVVVDWSPLALFSSTFEADRITAARVELARLPKSDGATAGQGSGGLPVSLALHDIDLPDVALGPDLAGGVAAVSAKGSVLAEASPMQVEADLKVARTDGRAGNVDASVHFVPDQNLLDVDVSASEPAGGIIANLLKLPGEPAVDIKLRGSGPAADWAGMGSFAIDGVVVTEVVGRHRLTGEGNEVEANGRGDFSRFLPEAFRPLLAGTASFDISGTATSAGGIDVERATIESDAVRGTASGMIDPQGASDFSLELAAKAETGVPLSFGTVDSPIDMLVQSASVRAIGAGDEPNLDIAAALASVKTNSAEIANLAVALHSDAFNIRSRTGPVTGNASAAAIVIDNPTIAPLVAGKVSVDLAGTLSEDTLAVASGRLSSDALTGTFGGSVSLLDGSITVDLNADVASNALPAAIRGPLGERAAIAGTIVRDAAGHVSANPFSIASGGLSAQGNIAFSEAGIKATVEGALAELGAVAQGVSGPLQFSATASGNVSAPDVSVSATSPRVAFMGRDVQDLKLSANGKADAANPAADVSLTGTFGGEALSAKASIAAIGGRPEIRGLELALGRNRASGDLQLGANFLPSGQLALDLPDIAPLAALAGQTVSGDLTGTVRLDAAGSSPRMVLEAQSKSITRGDLAAADATLSATISDYLAQPGISGRIRAGSVTSGATVIADIDVALERDGEWTRFDGGAAVAGIPAKAAGRVRVAGGETAIELATGEATVSGIKAAVAQPATIRISGGNVNFDAVTLDVNGATAVISGSAGAAYDLNATVTAPNEGMVLSFGTAESPIDIVLRSASLKALGDSQSPALDVAASLSSIATNEARLESLDVALHSDAFDIASRTGPVTGNATASAVSLNNATLQPLITGTLKTSLTGTLGADSLEVANGSVSSAALNGAFSGSVSLGTGAITLKLDADVASSALPVAARGVLAERTALSGTVSRDPEGRISADDIALQSGSLEASGTAVVDTDTLEASLSGKLGDIGLLSQGASGAVDFALEAKGPVAAPDVTATVTSDLVQAAGRELSGLKLTATGKADAANPAAEVSLTASFNGEALSAKASLASVGERREIKGLTLALGQNGVSGDLLLDQNFLPSGTLTLAMPDIAPLAAMAGETATGDLQGTVRLEIAEGRPRMVVDAQSKSLARGEVIAAEASVNATIQDYLTSPAVSGRIRAATVTSGTTVIRDIDVMLSRDGDWTRFDGGASIAGIPARAAGRAKVANGETTVEVSAGEATVSGIKAAVAQPSTIRIAGGNVLLDSVTLDVNGATAVLSGSAGAAYDLNATVTAPNEGMALSFGTPESPIDIVMRSASLRALGDRNAPNLDVAASLSSVATNSARLESLDVALHSDAFDIAARTGPVSGTATAAALSLNNAALQPLITGTIKTAFAGTLGTDTLQVENGSMSSDALTGSFSGSVSLTTGAITLKVDTDIASAALPAPVRGVLAERTTLSGNIGRDAEGRISASEISLQSGGLAASGAAVVDKDALDASLSGKLADVGLLSPGATGAIDFAVSAKGASAAPDLSLTVTSDSIQAAGREIAGLKLTATGKADPANPAADVSLTGTVAGEALEGRASLATTAGRREIKGLSLSLGANRISGDLVLNDKFLPAGTVNFVLPDLGPLAALALETAEGDLAGTISFTDPDGKPQLSIDAKTAAISRGDISARDVSIGAVVADYASAPTISGKIRAATVTSGATVVRDIDVTLTRDAEWTGFDGGAIIADIPARAAGRVQVSGDRTIVELASGQATVRGIKTALSRATTIQIANGVTSLDRLALSLGSGSAVVSGTAGSRLNLDATLAAVPASLANTFAPGLAAAGSISGTAKVTGAASSPAVNYSITWTGAETAQTRSAGFGAMRVTSTGNFAGGKLSFDANAGDGSGLGIRGGGTVDTTARALALDFAGEVPFSFLTQRLAAQGLSLSGGANVSLQVRGPMGSPVVGGAVRASGARLVDSRSGIAVNDISADISLGGGTATIRSLTGTLSTRGSVSASGTVGIDPARGFPANLTVRIADGRYTDGRIVTATLSGDLAVKGALASAPTLSGTINLARTVITIPDRLPTSLSTLGVRHKNAPATVRQQDAALRPATETSGGAGGLTLDVTVNAANQIFVQGRGLDAELGGSLRLTGPVGSPQAAGQFTLNRGRLAILGKRLTFTRGTITFSGSMVPYLDLSADSTAGDATVTVTVNGPANNPRFDFSSVPALPEDEVLARLIFGRSMSNLSPLQIAQLADAAAQFSGAGGSNSLLESLRSKLGVDDLDVRTDEQGRTSVAVGKYLNDRTYFSIEKGDRAGSGKATIDLNVGRGVKLRGQASDDGQAKGGIFFEREY